MQYTEIYADDDDVSHFREVEISYSTSEFAAAGRPLGRSIFHGGQSGFLSVPAGWGSGWHQSPGDGFAILLNGQVEIETGDGDVRRFSSGDVWKSTDVTGRGHISRVVSQEDAAVFMTDFTTQITD